MTPESRLKNEILLECGRRNWLAFHINVGKIRLPNGSYFHTGVPTGWLDLTILTDFGLVFFVETKIKPRKPSAEQLEMQQILRDRGFIAEVIYDFKAFMALCDHILK